MNEIKNMKVLFIVVNAGFSDEAVNIARECGARGATIVNARGTGINHKNFLGLHFDPEKEMIMILVEESIAEKIMEAIKEQTGVETPTNGVCFTMPVDNMTLINYHNDETKNDK